MNEHTQTRRTNQPRKALGSDRHVRVVAVVDVFVVGVISGEGQIHKLRHGLVAQVYV